MSGDRTQQMACPPDPLPSGSNTRVHRREFDTIGHSAPNVRWLRSAGRDQLALPPRARLQRTRRQRRIRYLPVK